MTDDDLDRYRRLAETKTARRAELTQLAGDNFRDTHQGPYRIADRAIGQPAREDT